MNDNPYQAGIVSPVATKTRPTMWLVWLGCGLLTLAAGNVIAAIISMIRTFERVANAPAPRPVDLATEMVTTTYPLTAAGVYFLVGLVLLLVGLLRRKPVKQT